MSGEPQQKILVTGDMSSPLTHSELEALKKFAISWITVYRFIPPEAMLGLFLFIHRLNKQLELVQKSISQITIAQAPNVFGFSRELHNIDVQQHINRSMMR